MGQNQNVDKRTYRKENAELFLKLIQHYRKDLLSEQIDQGMGEANDSVKVFIRKRPIFEKEIKNGEFDVVTCLPNEIIVHDCRCHPSMKHHLAYIESIRFPYPGTEVFNENVSNEYVYAQAVKGLVDHVMDGQIGTLFCFGQTGSGKTYTISNIMKTLSEDLFSQLSQNQERFNVTATCIELYGDSCYDLLNDHAEVQLRDGKTGEVIICGNKLCKLKSGSELNELYTYAASLRETQSTKINASSSRSHYICRLFIEDTITGKMYAQLTVCDLAGSERNADSMYHDAERRKETASINSSLMALKEVIRCVALSKETDTKVHIPYRASKLTRLLKDCFVVDDEKLKKKPKTIVVATVSPIATDTEHTTNTLKHTCMMMSSDVPEGTKLVVQDVLGDDPFNKRALLLKPLAKFTVEETFEWIGSIEKGKFKKCIPLLPSTLDGKALSRMADKRLAQLLGDSLGMELRKAVLNYTDKVNQAKKVFAEDQRKVVNK